MLNELGGALDLPPKTDETFEHARLDPLRMKARLLIERFSSAGLWGWKDPRNSLTLPFWQDLLPGVKTLIMVRNPLEVAHSMKERNGTSYSFGLRLWEIYNGRLIETASKQERLVTHYDLFFENAEAELRRIAHFTGLPDSEVQKAAALVTKRRRHTYFTIEHLIDARVAPEVIELYRALIAESSAERQNKRTAVTADQTAKSHESELLPGAVTRLNAFVPEKIAQIEQLYQEFLAQAEARHKEQVEELSEHLARQNTSITETNQLLRDKSISLAESEVRAEELRKHLRLQLKAADKLCRFLDEADEAAARLRSSARWQIANPIAALKAKFSPRRARALLGYGHLERILSVYRTWQSTHPEVADIDDQIQALISGSVVSQRAAPVEPPVPTRPIEFPVHEQVEISIIITVFNQFRFTKACLASLQEHQGWEHFEVIVVADCSTDAFAETVPR